MLRNAVLLFAALMVLGSLLTLATFKFDWRKFGHSSLAAKILLWIPIFGVYLLFSYSSLPVRLLIIVGVAGATAREYWLQARRTPTLRLALLVAFVVMTAALAQFVAIGSTPNATVLLLAIGFASALSDVFAFFAGTLIGRHKLPTFINQSKSYEGVAGQLVGAFVGICLVRWLVAPEVLLLIWLPIGLGAAAGDLANSYLKRRANIKDWSSALPGHGGYADRFASLAGSAALAYIWLIGMP